MINHNGTVELTTKRLRLRRFTPDDAEKMYENWANDERVTRFLTWMPRLPVQMGLREKTIFIF